MPKFCRAAFVFFAAVAVAGCNSEAPLADDTQEIIGGTDSDATQNSVIRLTLRTDGGIYSCSGTLLAPNLVLTARHCVSATADGNVGCSPSGVGDSGGQVFGDYAPDDLIVGVGATRVHSRDLGVRPSGMKIYHDDATNLCNHDLSLILLDMKIAGALISPIRLDAPPLAGETFTAVGWGVTSSTPSPTTRQERQGVPIVAVGPGSGLPTNEFSVGEAPCSGDSGGPALDSTTDAIIGIVSRGGNGTPEDPNNPAASCTGGSNIYTQVAPFKDLILQAFADAGQMPWIEGQPNPLLGVFGASCAQNSDCQSNLCFGGGDASTGFCTADCTQTMCAAGYDCKANQVLGTQVCTVHVAAPKSGCSTSPTGDAAPRGLWLLPLGALAFFVRRRRAR